MFITNEYILNYKGKDVGYYYVYSDGSNSFTPGRFLEEEQKAALKTVGLDREMKRKTPNRRIAPFMKDEYRVLNVRRTVFVNGGWELRREPQETDEVFRIYRCSAEKGAPDYSPKDHSAPHWEGPETPEGMREWCTWYLFRKMDDGTYQAELDESWWWGGGHNDGGTIRTPIPEEWHALSYDDFLERVVGLSSAAHYGFDAEELKAHKGLKEFFGF
ncbi:MAG: hypothetical protein IJM18_10690 [Clostridia bacterium]|nr:hypothetical protein [Clostridia bacterium]